MPKPTCTRCSACWPTRKLIHSARDISDGGIAVALAQAAFPHGIGATIEQEQSLMVHPLFGLFAEPASTMLVTADPNQFAAIEELADEHGFFVARIGTTGGHRLEISVDGETFISAPIDELRKPWANALESTLHEEVTRMTRLLYQGVPGVADRTQHLELSSHGPLIHGPLIHCEACPATNSAKNAA